MKKYLTIIISLWVGALLLAGCQNKPAVEEKNETKLVITAVADEDIETRTAMVDDRDNGGGFHTEWQITDKLGVYTYNAEAFASDPYSITINNEFSACDCVGRVAKFEGSIRYDKQDREFDLYAYYPRNTINTRDNSTHSSVAININKTQVMPENGTHDPRVDYMVTTPKKVHVQGGQTHSAPIDNFSFRYVVGFVNLNITKVTRTLEDVKLTDEVKSVSMQVDMNNTNPVIAGEGKLNLEDGTVDFGANDGSHNKVTVLCTAGITLDDLNAWMVVNPFAFEDEYEILTFTITTTTHNIVKEIFIGDLKNSSLVVTAGGVKTFNMTINDDCVVTPAEEEPKNTKGIFTSNVTLPTKSDSGAAFYAEKVKVSGVEYPCFKLGKSAAGGTYTTPAMLPIIGESTLSFYAAAWNNAASVLTITINNGGTIDGSTSKSFDIATNAGVANNSPYTIIFNDETDYFEATLSGITESSTITFSTVGSSGRRCIVTGVNMQ